MRGTGRPLLHEVDPEIVERLQSEVFGIVMEAATRAREQYPLPAYCKLASSTRDRSTPNFVFSGSPEQFGEPTLTTEEVERAWEATIGALREENVMEFAPYSLFEVPEYSVRGLHNPIC